MNLKLTIKPNSIEKYKFFLKKHNKLLSNYIFYKKYIKFNKSYAPRRYKRWWNVYFRKVKTRIVYKTNYWVGKHTLIEDYRPSGKLYFFLKKIKKINNHAILDNFHMLKQNQLILRELESDSQHKHELSITPEINFSDFFYSKTNIFYL